MKRDYIKNKVCDATYINNNIYIELFGYGLVTKNLHNFTTAKVNVAYSGKIGKRDFQYEIIAEA